VLTLVGAGLGAPLLCAALLALQPTVQKPLGPLAEAGTRLRVVGGLALAAAAGCCLLADRRLFVGLYPDAHLALRMGFLWLASFALAVLTRVRARALGRTALLAVCLAVLGIVLGERAGSAMLTLTLRPWPRFVVDGVRRLSDVDLDGYSALLMGGDCAPFDPKVYPTAPEIPGNKIDDNCLLGDAKPVAKGVQRLTRPTQPAPLDVVLITVDSLRADRVGAYCPACRKKGLATTPNIDAFARGAVVFDRAYTPGGWTSIAVSAFMRGVYPRRLVWTRMYETDRFRLVPWGHRNKLPPGESLTKMFPLPVSDPHVSIADWLAQRGMRTIAVADDEFSELLSPESGIATGFDIYREVDSLPKRQRGDDGTTDLALSEMARVPGGQRFFMWVHYFGPHSPSVFHEGVRLDGPTLEQGYEHEIRYADIQIGRLLRAIAERGQPTAVFIAADHGEEFIEGGRHHGFSLREDVARVPLLARVPGWPGGLVATPVSLIDLFPTFCELTGTPPPAGMDGRSLAPVVAAGRLASQRVLFADTWQYDRLGRLVRAESAAIDGNVKVLYEPFHSGWSQVRLPETAQSVREPLPPNAPLPAVRALSAYVESASGPLQLRY
jgi:hypothetical protein